MQKDLYFEPVTLTKPSKHAVKCMLSFPLLLKLHIDENRSMANHLLMLIFSVE